MKKCNVLFKANYFFIFLYLTPLIIQSQPLNGNGVLDEESDTVDPIINNWGNDMFFWENDTRFCVEVDSVFNLKITSCVTIAQPDLNNQAPLYIDYSLGGITPTNPVNAITFDPAEHPIYDLYTFCIDTNIDCTPFCTQNNHNDTDTPISIYSCPPNCIQNQVPNTTILSFPYTLNILTIDSTTSQYIPYPMNKELFPPEIFGMTPNNLIDGEKVLCCPNLHESISLVSNSTAIQSQDRVSSFKVSDYKSIKLIDIFPNPIFNELFIKPKLNSYIEKKILIEVHDIFGKQIYKNNIGVNANGKKINTENWKSGIYIMKATTVNLSQSELIIK